MPKSMHKHLPSLHMEKANQNDFRFWADNQDVLDERFNAWLVQ